MEMVALITVTLTNTHTKLHLNHQHSSFYTGQMPFVFPANSISALKAAFGIAVEMWFSLREARIPLWLTKLCCGCDSSWSQCFSVNVQAVIWGAAWAVGYHDDPISGQRLMGNFMLHQLLTFIFWNAHLCSRAIYGPVVLCSFPIIIWKQLLNDFFWNYAMSILIADWSEWFVVCRCSGSFQAWSTWKTMVSMHWNFQQLTKLDKLRAECKITQFYHH